MTTDFYIFIYRAVRYIKKKIGRKLWKGYFLWYCKRKGVIFKDEENLKINGYLQTIIDPNSNCCIGKEFIINNGPEYGFGDSPSKIVVCNNAKLTIGDYSGMSSTTLYCSLEICIGDYVNIGGGCVVTDDNHHSLDWRDREDRKKDVQTAKKAPVHIGNYVFIGSRCIILKGVTIGDRSIIQAGSVVTTNIPPDCIAGGNPCKVIKKVYTKEEKN